MTTKLINKLVNADGRCYWHYGHGMWESIRAGMRATGRVRNCPAARRAAVEIANERLRTAIKCGFDRVIEVEDAYRHTVVVNIQLPVGLEAAVVAFNAIS